MWHKCYLQIRCKLMHIHSESRTALSRRLARWQWSMIGWLVAGRIACGMRQCWRLTVLLSITRLYATEAGEYPSDRTLNEYLYQSQPVVASNNMHACIDHSGSSVLPLQHSLRCESGVCCGWYDKTLYTSQPDTATSSNVTSSTYAWHTRSLSLCLSLSVSLSLSLSLSDANHNRFVLSCCRKSIIACIKCGSRRCWCPNSLAMAAMSSVCNIQTVQCQHSASTKHQHTAVNWLDYHTFPLLHFSLSAFPSTSANLQQHQNVSWSLSHPTLSDVSSWQLLRPNTDCINGSTCVCCALSSCTFNWPSAKWLRQLTSYHLSLRLSQKSKTKHLS